MAVKFLTMVGQLQWLVTLERFNVHAQVATLSRFRAAPRQGHMDRLKSIYAYAIRIKDYAVRFRSDQLDYSFLPEKFLIRLTLFMVMSMKSFLMTYQNHLVSMCLPFMQAKGLLLKLTTSHFNSLNTKYVNETMMKRILITMHDEKKANSNENFRIYS